MLQWLKNLFHGRPKSLSVAIRGALAHGQPGAWASNHRLEAEKFTGWNYVAIHALAMQAAQASVYVFDDSPPQSTRWRSTRKKRSGVARSYGADDATRPLPETHPLVQLLTRPSATQSGAMFRYEQVLQLRLTGACLIWNVPSRLGVTVQRHVLPTAALQPRSAAAGFSRGGWYLDPALVGRWSALGDAQGFADLRGFSPALGRVIPAEQVQVIRLPHPLWCDEGQSPLSAAALWTDTAEQIDHSRWSHLRNGPEPSLIVAAGEQTSVTEEELERAAARFNQKYSGPGNHGRAIFTSGASSVTPVGAAPKDMAYDQGFTQLRDAILAVHGVPAVAAGLTDGGSYAAFYASLLQFTTLTVQPLLNLLAEEDARQLAPQFGPHLAVEMEAAAINDPQIQEQELATDLAAGAISINELRALRGRAPWPDGNRPAGQTAPIAGAKQARQQGPGAANETLAPTDNIQKLLVQVRLSQLDPDHAWKELLRLGLAAPRADQLIAEALQRQTKRIVRTLNRGLNGHHQSTSRNNSHAAL